MDVVVVFVRRLDIKLGRNGRELEGWAIGLRQTKHTFPNYGLKYKYEGIEKKPTLWSLSRVVVMMNDGSNGDLQASQDTDEWRGQISTRGRQIKRLWCFRAVSSGKKTRQKSLANTAFNHFSKQIYKCVRNACYS